MSRKPSVFGLAGLTQLYRHYDARKRLLYVGISLSAVSRLSQHKDKTWFTEIARVTVENFPSREMALSAEAAAIKAERPLYNKAKTKSDDDCPILSDLQRFWETKKYKHLTKKALPDGREITIMKRGGTSVARIDGKIGTDAFHAEYARAYLRSDSRLIDIWDHSDWDKFDVSSKGGRLSMTFVALKEAA